MRDDTDHADHDDGLVHAHGWWRTRSPGESMQPTRVQDITHDDGLVHEHDWATAQA